MSIDHTNPSGREPTRRPTRNEATEAEQAAARHARLLYGWSVGGRERFGEDGGPAAEQSCRDRRIDPRCADLVHAISRGLVAESYLRGGYSPEASAEKLGMEITHKQAGVLRLIADVRLLVACERGMLAHVGCDGFAGSGGASRPLTLVQAEIAVGVRDFDGEYTGAFAALAAVEQPKGGAA